MNLASRWVNHLNILAQLVETRQCQLLTQVRENTGNFVHLVDLRSVRLVMLRSWISGYYLHFSKERQGGSSQ